MNSLKLIPLLYFFILCSTLISCKEQNQTFLLSEQEQQWLKEHKKAIRVAKDPRYPPMDFRNKKGEIVGISNDYLQLIERKLNIQLIRLQEQPLEENLNSAKMGKVDMVTSIANTPQRSKFLTFTEPYFETPAVIIVNRQIQRRLTVEDLVGRKVSVGNRFAVHDYLENHYPELKLDLVADDREGLKKLAFGETDVLIADLGSTSYYLEKSGISNLHVAGTTDFVYKIAIGVRKDLSILRNILNKTLASLSKEEKKKIQKRWVFLSTREFWERKNFWYWMVLLLLFIGTGTTYFLTWNRTLKKLVVKRTAELKRELNIRLKIEQSLKDSEERYGIVARQKGQIVYDYNLSDHSILWFGDIRYTTGYSLKEYSEFNLKDWQNFIHPDDRDNAISKLKSSISSGDDYEIIYRYQHKDGSYIPILSKGTFLKEIDGTPYRMLGIMSDISLQIKKEKQLQIAKKEAEKADRLKTQFLANMSHEIRTPMNGILGFSSILAQSNLSKDKQLAYAKIIQQSSEYLQKIINDILDTSMIECEQLKIFIKPLALNNTIEAVIQYFRTNPKLQQNIITLQSDLAFANGQDQIETDEIRLKQILINLTGNALKYTQAGNILIKYSLHNQDCILFEISDTGIGIPADHLEHIFERFGQVESTDAKKYGGTGLGLSISKSLIELLGGKIWCKSQPGKGTSFYFTLPYPKSKEASPKTVPAGKQICS
ncbi:MAG: ATP-binding protein [Marinifilaceae bacterium]